MLHLAKAVYPGENSVAIVATIFYIFNFSILSILLNIGMMWTYAFLPLLIAFFIKALTRTQNKHKHIIYFAITFTIIASISSMNFANIVVIIISLASILLYYIILARKISTGRLAKTLATLLIITSLLSVWWLVPNLNYYLLSPSTQLQQEVNVLSWSWTHVRASFLNLFWLNGGWGWRPEYFSYYKLYSNNAVLSFLLFVPFLLASSALLFKDEKTKFNAYVMLIILLFTFLAKGLHEPLGFVNLFLYNYVPYMSMFREPVSKFTLTMIPFLALLIGYATDKIAKTLTHHKLKQSIICSKLFIISVALIFAIATFPILTNPIETKTEQLPYSTYVKIPQYWNETSEWLSNKTGDFRILVTPLDDHYMVPYAWGYYGTDTFIERLIQKPLISPCYEYSYQVNPNIVVLMNQLHDAIKYNETEEFQTIISMLNVKYILQRNDLDYEYLTSINRYMVSSEKMRIFLSNRSDISMVKTIGKLDIYEYMKVRTYVRIFDSKEPQEYNIEVATEPTLALQWNFDSIDQLSEWKRNTAETQFDATSKLYLDKSALKFDLWNSTWGWKKIASPLISAPYEAKYRFKIDVKGENTRQVHIKVLEYDKKMETIHVEYVFYVSDGTFNWKNIQINYTPKNENTTFLQLQIWNGHETDKPFPNIVWIDNVEIQGYTTKLNTAKIQQALETSPENLRANITEYERLNPTKIIVKVNASESFILAINEAHEPNWKAYLEGETYNSVPIFSVMNGFKIDKTGQLEIVIEYEPQKWFNYGLVISFTTVLVCVTYLAYSCSKEQDLVNRIKTKLHKLRRGTQPHHIHLNPKRCEHANSRRTSP